MKPSRNIVNQGMDGYCPAEHAATVRAARGRVDRWDSSPGGLMHAPESSPDRENGGPGNLDPLDRTEIDDDLRYMPIGVLLYHTLEDRVEFVIGKNWSNGTDSQHTVC